MNKQIDCMRALRQIQSHESTLHSASTLTSDLESVTEKKSIDTEPYEATGVVTWSTDLLPIVEVGVTSTRTEGL